MSNPYACLKKRCKLVFLGNSRAGKTTLLVKLKTGFFKQTISNVSADLVNIEKETESGNILEFNIWDTAGQEEYKSLTQNYVRNAKYAVICFDPKSRNFSKQIDDWTQFLRDKGEKSTKICLVATKSDLYEDDENLIKSIESTIKNKRDKISFHIVSSVTGSNVEAFFQTIVNDFEQNEDSKDFEPNPIIQQNRGQNSNCSFNPSCKA